MKYVKMQTYIKKKKISIGFNDGNETLLASLENDDFEVLKESLPLKQEEMTCISCVAKCFRTTGGPSGIYIL